MVEHSESELIRLFIEMRDSLIYALVFLIFMSASAVKGQDCDFEFDLGEDIILDCGQSGTLEAPAEFDTYLWSTGSTDQSITVSESGIYTCTISTIQDNLVINGDFSDGDTGFDTDYIVGTGGPWGPVSNEGTYAISSNSMLVHNNFASCLDHTTGLASGSMFIANGANTVGTVVWEQTIAVSANTDYLFSAWFMSVVAGSPAQFSMVINGVNVGDLFQIDPALCNWQNFFANYNSGTNTSITISIINNNTDGSGNDFAIDDITFSPACIYTDEIEVTAAPIPVLTLSEDATICLGETIVLEATSNVPESTFDWGVGSTDGNQLSITPAATVQYTVIATSPQGCNSPPQSVTVTVTDPGVYNLDVSANYFICDGEPVNLTFPIANSGTYQWSPAAFLDDATAANPNADVNTETAFTVVYTNVCGQTQTATTVVSVLGGEIDLGDDIDICEGMTHVVVLPAGPAYTWQDGTTGNTYTISQTGLYTVNILQGNCQSTGSVFASIAPNPDITITGERNICLGETVVLSATPNAAYTYEWSNGATTPEITIASGGNYTVTATDISTGCSTVSEVDVKSSPAIRLVVPDTVTICKGKSQTIMASVNARDSVVWDDGTLGTHYTVSEPGIYTVSTYSACGTATKTIEVFQQDCSFELYIPSAFTPDGDGLNDLFKAYGYNIETFKITIFDRWGKVVFQSDNMDKGWNGSDFTGGYFVPSGEYPYKVEVQYDKSMDTEIIHGSVTVVR